MFLAACGAGGDSGSSDNGEASRPAEQILKDSVAALRTAETVHMVGELPAAEENVGLDLHLDRSGKVQGTMTLGTVTAGLVVTGGRTYLKGRGFFAKYGSDQAASAFGDHWVAMPAGPGPGTDIVQVLSDFTDFNKLADVLASPTGGAVTKGATNTVDGRSVVALRASDSTLYVATTGRPYPVELKPDAGSKPLHFMSWDASVNVEAPRDPLDFTAALSATPSRGASPTP
jgi:hypothetical protein